MVPLVQYVSALFGGGGGGEAIGAGVGGSISSSVESGVNDATSGAVGKTAAAASGASAAAGITVVGGSTLRCQTEAQRSGGSSYWRTVQTTLCSRGFDPGVIDGRVGTNTRSAVTAFQRAQGLSATGRVDSTTGSRLGVSAEPVRSASTVTTTAPTEQPTAPTPPPGWAARFFDLSNPTLWLTAAGVLLVGGGVVYGVQHYRKSKRTTRSVPDTMVEDNLASMKARLGR